MMNKFFIILSTFAFCFVGLSEANWWYLGLRSTSNKRDVANNMIDMNKVKFENIRYCHNEKILSSEMQRKLCKRNAQLVDVMSKAAKLAIEECQYQFKFKRWNCSIFNNTQNIYGGLTRTRSKETAFIYSVYSAAAMYEITKACSRGDLKKCSCNQQQQKYANTNQLKQYQFGGCSDNVLFGYKLSKHFVDSNEYLNKNENEKNNSDLTKEEYKLMNLHNNEVGRRIILKNMKDICKCHGISGSCSVKVCWKIMPDFRKIGNELTKRYNEASQLKERQVKKRVEKLLILNRRSTANNQQIMMKSSDSSYYKENLIFIDRSPNFCRRDRRLNTPGTRGRMCSLKASNQTILNEEETEQKIETCEYLCCGRGYYSKTIETEEECDCQFQWCCSVKCKKCKKKVVQYYCK